MLYSKWDTHDGTAEDCAKQEMREGDPESSNANPDQIHQKAQCPRMFRFFHRISKWKNTRHCKFKTLQAKRDANYRYAHGQSGGNVL